LGKLLNCPTTDKGLGENETGQLYKVVEWSGSVALIAMIKTNIF
jgi:hypothetical protein